MNKKKRNTLIVIFGFLILGISLIISWRREAKEDQLLQNSIETVAFLKRNKPAGYRSGGSGDFYFVVKGMRYDFNISGSFNFLEIGDTILIEYAKKSPSVVRLKDEYYMKKYQHLKNEEL